MRSVVVFPAPFGPRSPKITPCGTSKESPSTARTSPVLLRNVLTRSRTTTGAGEFMTSGLETGGESARLDPRASGSRALLDRRGAAWSRGCGRLLSCRGRLRLPRRRGRRFEKDLAHRRQRSFSGGPLEPAARLVARERGAPLPLAVEEVWVAALGTGLGDRADVQREVARRVVRAAVERPEPAAPLDDHAAVLRAPDARVLDRLRWLVLARRVVRARHVSPEAAVTPHQVSAALGARLTRGLVGARLGLASRHHDVHYVAALRVGGAPEERVAAPPLPQLHGRAALLARRRLEVGGVDRVLVRVGDVQRERAVGVPAARDEEPVLAHPQLQLLAAVRARLRQLGRDGKLEEPPRLPERDPRLAGHHGFECAVAVLREFLVELRERVAPGDRPLLDLVQAVLHPRRVPRLEEVVEVGDQELQHGPAEGRRHEAAVLLPHVLAVLELAEDLRVRRRPPDSVLLEELHEGRLVVARRRLRRLLLRLDRDEL